MFCFLTKCYGSRLQRIALQAKLCFVRGKLLLACSSNWLISSDPVFWLHIFDTPTCIRAHYPISGWFKQLTLIFTHLKRSKMRIFGFMILNKKLVQVKAGSLPRTEAFGLLRSEHSDFFDMAAEFLQLFWQGFCTKRSQTTSVTWLWFPPCGISWTQLMLKNQREKRAKFVRNCQLGCDLNKGVESCENQWQAENETIKQRSI